MEVTRGGQPHRLLSGVDVEAVSEGGLERLGVVLSQFHDRVVGLGSLVRNDAKHVGLGLRFPLTHQLQVRRASVQHAHMDGSSGWGREGGEREGEREREHIL